MVVGFGGSLLAKGLLVPLRRPPLSDGRPPQGAPRCRSPSPPNPAPSRRSTVCPPTLTLPRCCWIGRADRIPPPPPSRGLPLRQRVRGPQRQPDHHHPDPGAPPPPPHPSPFPCVWEREGGTRPVPSHREGPRVPVQHDGAGVPRQVRGRLPSEQGLGNDREERHLPGRRGERLGSRPRKSPPTQRINGFSAVAENVGWCALCCARLDLSNARFKVPIPPINSLRLLL